MDQSKYPRTIRNKRRRYTNVVGLYIVLYTGAHVLVLVLENSRTFQGGVIDAISTTPCLVLLFFFVH